MPELSYQLAFRFWIGQDTSGGGDPGLAAGDLTTSGLYIISPMREAAAPDSRWSCLSYKIYRRPFSPRRVFFWKQDFLKAWIGDLGGLAPAGCEILLLAKLSSRFTPASCFLHGRLLFSSVLWLSVYANSRRFNSGSR